MTKLEFAQSCMCVRQSSSSDSLLMLPMKQHIKQIL